MKLTKLGKVLQWLGFILIALVPFQAAENPQSIYILIFMISGTILGLLGSIILKANKLIVVALCLALLSVIFYFYFEKNLPIKILIVASLVLAIVGTFFERKNHQLNQKI